MFSLWTHLVLFTVSVVATQAPLTHLSVDITSEEWYKKYGPQSDLGYSGPNSFMHLPYSKCLEDASEVFDIAILGMPFDTTTSYRAGARFGPQTIRIASGRGGYTLAWGQSTYDFGKIIDCGDIPTTPMDNAKAIDQMEVAYSTLLARPVKGGDGPDYKPRTKKLALDGQEHPRIVTLGGDHTIVLPILRSLHKVYGPVSVIHFDSHFDTGNVKGQTGQGRITHGSYFAVAAEEHLMATNSSIHGGIRQKMVGSETLDHDQEVGFQVISAEDIDDYGVKVIIQKIRERVGDSPVYLSLDIDVIDPGLAPATGTPEISGWTTREMRRILRGLTGLNFVGVDVVEVAPAYDNAEITSRAAVAVVFDFLNMMQMDAPPEPHKGPFGF